MAAALVVALCLLVGGADAHSRTYHQSREETTAGDLKTNLFTSPPPLTTGLAHSTWDNQWVSFTPAAIVLQDHSGVETEWPPHSFTGYPSTQAQSEKYRSVIQSSSVGLDTGNYETAPPASVLSVGFTSYTVMEDMALAENQFFVQSPNFLQYVLPACPNYKPGDTSAQDCPAHNVAGGSWKFSIMGLLSGTNINSLKSGRALPTTTEDYNAHAERDIADYTTLIYRTTLDVGALDSKVSVLWANGTSMLLDDVPAAADLVDATLQFTPPAVDGANASDPLNLTFVEHYSTGTYTRNLADAVCTRAQADAERADSTFGDCARDVSGLGDGGHFAQAQPGSVRWLVAAKLPHLRPPLTRPSAPSPALQSWRSPRSTR